MTSAVNSVFTSPHKKVRSKISCGQIPSHTVTQENCAVRVISGPLSISLYAIYGILIIDYNQELSCMCQSSVSHAWNMNFSFAFIITNLSSRQSLWVTASLHTRKSPNVFEKDPPASPKIHQCQS